MNLWIVTQHFAPEFGAAAIRLTRLAGALAERGHQVHVFAPMPNYPDGVVAPPYRGRLHLRETVQSGAARYTVHRAWVFATPNKGSAARLATQFTAMLGAAALGTLARPGPDVLLVESHPLPMVLAGGWLKRIRRAPIVLNVSDLWPESAVASGALRAESAIVRAAEHVERWAYRDAAHRVGLTAGVVAGILRVDNRPEATTLLVNAVDLTRFRPATADERAAARAAFSIPADAFTAVHVGNLSLTYRFEPILDAAARLCDTVFVFAGGGSQAGRLEAAVNARGLRNVRLLGLLAHEAMPAVWALADAALVSLGDHSVAGGTLPAKMLEALATGTPIAAAIRGEGAALLADTGAGLAVPPEDSAGLADALAHLRAHPAERAAMGARGRAFAERALSADALAARYERILLAAARPR